MYICIYIYIHMYSHAGRGISFVCLCHHYYHRHKYTNIFFQLRIRAFQNLWIPNLAFKKNISHRVQATFWRPRGAGVSDRSANDSPRGVAEEAADALPRTGKAINTGRARAPDAAEEAARRELRDSSRKFRRHDIDVVRPPGHIHRVERSRGKAVVVQGLALGP